MKKNLSVLSPTMHPKAALPSLDFTLRQLIESYEKPGLINLMGGKRLPAYVEVKSWVENVYSLLFPGFYTHPINFNFDQLKFWGDEQVHKVYNQLIELVYQSITAGCRCTSQNSEPDDCLQKSVERAFQFVQGLPELRHKLILDVEATFQGDPAANYLEEIVLCYPGLNAIMTYRIAHELYSMEIPFMPRMISEYAHRNTGIDIHPGAKIGQSFCIDHGTGIVIGETAVIGNHCKLYQNVTLGALSLPRKVLKRNTRTKRHPTLEDEVIIYAGTTILGGDTVIGLGSLIGGNVWLTSSVPPYSKITRSTEKTERKPNLRNL